MSDSVQELAKARQILNQGGGEHNGYTLYSSGLLVQTIQITVTSIEKEIVFPATFPCVVTTVQAVGGNIKVLKLGKNKALLQFDQADVGTKIKLIFSGQ